MSGSCRTTPEQSCGGHGDEEQGVHEREQDGSGQHQRERREELADHALQQPERNEYDDRRQRRSDDGADELVGAVLGRRVRRVAGGEMPMDVFHDDNRIVNDETDGDGEAAHRHEIDGAVGEAQDEKRSDDGQRERRGGHERGPPVAQKSEQDEHG